MDYSKQTVDQIKATLKKQGVVFPSKARKGDLVTMLVEEDAKKKQNAAGGGSKVTKAHPYEASGSRPRAADAPPNEVWIIETESRFHHADEPDTNIVGVFTSKKEAVKNAKISIANMDLFEDFGGWDAVEDYSEKFNNGCKRGVLFSICDEGGEGDTISVNMYKSFIDKPIKPITAIDSDSDEQFNLKSMKPNSRRKVPRDVDTYTSNEEQNTDESDYE